MFERKIERKIYGPVEEGTWWRGRTNKEVKNILQRTDIVNLMCVCPCIVDDMRRETN